MDFFNIFVVDGRHRSRFSPPRLGLDSRAWEFIAEGLMTLDTHPILDVERRLGGTGPFVINLHASTAPIGLPSKSPAGNEHARLYQIQRVDDGRIRYRLRLGPFATEDEAEIALAQSRLGYSRARVVTGAAEGLCAR